MRPTLVLVVALALLTPGCGVYFLQRDPNELKPVVAAPAFSLPSAAGHLVTLDELRAAGNVVLVFYRGHW